METFFGIPTGRLAAGALAALAALAVVLGWRAWRWPIFLRLGVRQLPRRPAQTALVVAGLLLSTALMAASLSTGDTISHALRAAAVNELGPLDEIVTFSGQPSNPATRVDEDNPFASTTFFSPETYQRIEAAVRDDPALAREVAGMTPALWLGCTLV